MNSHMTEERISSPKAIRALFALCWLVYFTAYLGRLNYAACLAEISAAEGWTKSQAGLVATSFFICYGLGQLINGIIGDRISPKIMVGIGIGCSGIVNFCFPLLAVPAAAAILWCVNGLVQSMIWSPLVRLLSEWLPPEKRQKACVNMNSTVPAGTLAAYGMSAALIHLSGWRTVFFTSGLLLTAMAAVWLFSINKIEAKAEPARELSTAACECSIHGKAPIFKLAAVSAVPFACAALIFQGMLKDGVTTWIPTFLGEEFGISSSAAILSTTVVPIVNLAGVYLASWLNERLFKNELLGAACFFAGGAAALLLLNFLPSGSAVFSLSMLAVTTTFMMGINTILVSMLPSYYVKFGRCSTISGILNSSVYIGSAVSSYTNGAIVQQLGWSTIMLFWLVYAVLGIVICLAAVRKWHSFSSAVSLEQS